MTIAELEKILAKAPEDAFVLIHATDIDDVETVSIEYHADGRVHVILSALD